jgi:hypothetical protein
MDLINIGEYYIDPNCKLSSKILIDYWEKLQEDIANLTEEAWRLHRQKREAMELALSLENFRLKERGTIFNIIDL